MCVLLFAVLQLVFVRLAQKLCWRLQKSYGTQADFASQKEKIVRLFGFPKKSKD